MQKKKKIAKHENLVMTKIYLFIFGGWRGARGAGEGWVHTKTANKKTKQTNKNNIFFF